jgi:helix-turn-helix protein
MVQVWSGREVRALRESQRLSIREFAARIGVSERMVSRWEAGGESIRPRPINQEGLDSLLAAASEDEKSRFAAHLQSAKQADRESISASIPGAADPPMSSHRARPTERTAVARPERAQSPDVFAMQSFRSADKQVAGICMPRWSSTCTCTSVRGCSVAMLSLRIPLSSLLRQG